MKIFLILGVFISCRSALGICTGSCNEPTLMYDLLNCVPKFSSSDDCCPVKYDCEEKGNEDKCYFGKKAYANHESVNSDDTYGNCQVDCSCNFESNGTAKPDFTCAVLDCPEWLGYRPEPGCRFKYELGKCCQAGQICNETNSVCMVKGKALTVNTKFNHPTEKCTECICDKNFTEEFKELSCRKLKCLEEINHQRQVYSFCAPSYLTLEDCCPLGWICPKENDKIESNGTTTSDNKCKFGTTLLNVGDKITRTKGEGKASCECRIPPYLTCIQNSDYSNYGDE